LEVDPRVLAIATENIQMEFENGSWVLLVAIGCESVGGVGGGGCDGDGGW